MRSALLPDRQAWRVVYVVATTLMLYTHVYSVFVIAAQVTSLVLVWRREPGAFQRVVKPWLVAASVVLLLYSPWTISLVDQVSRVQGAFWIARPLLIAVLHPLLVYSGSAPLALMLFPSVWLLRLREASGGWPNYSYGRQHRPSLCPWPVARGQPLLSSSS
jgi:uncharacterized membrane protein